MKFKFIRLVRRVVPSTATLSYNRIFKIIGNGITFLPDRIYPEFAKLPPNHLRVRVGVGNQLLNNQAYHLTISKEMWFDWLSKGYFSATSDIVEIGCGCGRYAQHLDAAWFTGTYVGIDIDKELIVWSQRRFEFPKFRFQLSPQRSQTYADSASGDGLFSFGNESAKDFVYATSLFTHLLENETRNYFAEVGRILRPGGIMYITFFSMQHVALGSRWTFKHRMGNAYVENMRSPEAAVAYDEKFLVELAQTFGFSEVKILPSAGQSALVARK